MSPAWPRPTVPVWRRLGARLVLLGLLIATGWFFLRVWRNVETLAERTLPGLQYAVEMMDAAADLHVAGMRPGAEVETAAGRFREALQDYEATIGVEQDRANLRAAGQAFELHLRSRTEASAERLRGAVRTLHAFRHGRALMFASDSRDGFTSALAVNAVAFVAFAVLSFIASLLLGLRRPVPEPRPDDF